MYCFKDPREVPELQFAAQAAAENDFVDFWLTLTGKGGATGNSNVLAGRPSAAQILQVTFWGVLCPNSTSKGNNGHTRCKTVQSCAVSHPVSSIQQYTL